MQASKPQTDRAPAARAWGLAAITMMAGLMAAGWSTSAQQAETNPLWVLSGDLIDPKPGRLSINQDLVALSFPTTSPRANVHGGAGLFSKSSSPSAYDVCLAQAYGGTLGASQPYTQTGRVAIRAGSSSSGSETLPVGRVPCSASSLQEAQRELLEGKGGTDLATGFFVGLQGQLGRSTGANLVPVPGSVQWYLVPCSVATTTFAPSVLEAGRASRVQSCGSPALPVNVSPYVRDLAVPDVGTSTTLPRLDDLIPPSVVGNRWIVSCVRLNALVATESGGWSQVNGITAHDWFLALDENDPTWPSAFALSLDASRTYDRSGGNGCPVPLPPPLPPPASVPCVDSWTEFSGVEAQQANVQAQQAQAAEPQVPRFVGAANFDLGIGAGRTATVTRVDAPAEWLTSRTTVQQLNVDSWQFTPHIPGLHRVEIHVETQCRAPFSGLPEILDLIVEILVPGNECELWKTEDTSANLQFIVGLTTLPPGIAVGSNFHFGTVTSVHDSVAKILVAEVALPAYPVFANEVTALPELKYCFQRVPFPEASAVPNDDLYDPMGPPPVLGQWGMDNVGMEQLWDHGFGTASKSLCVVDTDYTPDFEDSDTARFVNGFNPFTGVTSTSSADLWFGLQHGTATTSVAVGDTNDNWGIAGSAEVDYYFSVTSNPPDPFAMYLGVWWCAVDQDVDVINLSMGADPQDINPGDEDDVATFFEDMMDEAGSSGALVVAAAGNRLCPGDDCVHYPARFAEAHNVLETTTGTWYAYPGKDFVIAVGCNDAANAQCDWTADVPNSGSSEGDAVTVVAPGNDILAVHDGCPPTGFAGPCTVCPDGVSGPIVEHCYNDGTSFSAPLVAGAAALIWAADPTLTAAQVRHYIECTADDLGAAGNDNVFGHGRLDADQAWDAADQGTCTPGPVCSGQILEPDGTPVDPGDSFTGYTVFTVSHTGAYHVSSWTFTTSDGVMPGGGPVGHDGRSVAFGGWSSRTVTATAHLGTPVACTATATWTHTN